MEMLRDLLALSHVPRWTTHPVAKQQFVDSHSFRVAAICLHLMDHCDMPGESGEKRDKRSWGWRFAVIRWALTHDGPENRTSDLPSPIKEALGREALYALECKLCTWYKEEAENHSDPVTAFVKLADTIEAYSWLRRYGHGFKDKMDSELIENKLTRRIWLESDKLDGEFNGLQQAVRDIMSEVG